MAQARHALEAAVRDQYGRMTEALLIRLGERAQPERYRDGRDRTLHIGRQDRRRELISPMAVFYPK